MASRKEEKERLRREREEAERAAQAGDARRKRLAIVLGTVLVAAVALIVVLAVASGDDEGPSETQAGDVSVPARQISDLDEAAKAAGCTVKEYPSEGRGHDSKDVEYKTNPPTSGTHDPVAAQDGVYPEAPDVEQSVHALEHGRVNVQYKPGTPQERVAQLEAMVGEEVQGTGGFHTLLFENQTEMKAAVAATSWTRALTCPTFDDKVFDAVRAFREKAIIGEWQSDIPEPVP